MAKAGTAETKAHAEAKTHAETQRRRGSEPAGRKSVGPEMVGRADPARRPDEPAETAENAEVAKVRLGEVCAINMGQSPDSSSYNNAHDGLPFYQGNADFGERYPTPRLWCRVPKKVADVGNILISVRAPIGALNFANERCCIGRGLAALKPSPRCDGSYVFYALKSLTGELNKRGTGSTFKAINKKSLETVEIPLPPLPTQRRIAAELDQICALKKNTEERLVILDQLAKSRFVEMFGDPVNNSLALPLRKLGDLGKWSSGGTPSRQHPEYFNGKIDWYSAGELNSYELPPSNEKITEEALQNSSAKLWPVGSLLIGMYDTAAFKMGTLTRAAASNQACACLIPHEDVDLRWLYTVLGIMRESFLGHRHGCRQKNLSLGMIKDFEIPWAELEQQREFAVFIDQLDKSKLTLRETAATLDQLYRAKLQEYFG